MKRLAALGLAALLSASCVDRAVGTDVLDAGRPDVVQYDAGTPDSSTSLDSAVDSTVDETCENVGCDDQNQIIWEYAPGQCGGYLQVGFDSEGNIIRESTGNKIHYQEIVVDGELEYIPENFPIMPGEMFVTKKTGGSLPGFMRIIRYNSIELEDPYNWGLVSFFDLSTGSSINAQTTFDPDNHSYHGTLNIGGYFHDFRVFQGNMHIDLNDDGVLDGSKIQEFEDLISCLYDTE